MEHSPKLAKKRRLTGWMTLPVVLAVLAVIMMISVGSGPKRIITAEEIDLLASHTVEKVVTNDGTQTVPTTLTKDYKYPKCYLPKEDLFGIEPDPVVGKEVVSTYVRPQAETVATAVAKTDPQKGHDSIYPVSTWWESMLALMIPMLLLFDLFF